jgi:hypothetical protein
MVVVGLCLEMASTHVFMPVVDVSERLRLVLM